MKEGGRAFAEPNVAIAAALSSVELFDPASGSFTRGPDLNEARFWHTATVLADGSLLVSGGAGSSGGIRLDMKNTAEVFR